MAGRPLGIFDGVPVAIKDELDMTPYPTNRPARRFWERPGQRKMQRVVARCEGRARS